MVMLRMSKVAGRRFSLDMFFTHSTVLHLESMSVHYAGQRPPMILARVLL